MTERELFMLAKIVAGVLMIPVWYIVGHYLLRALKKIVGGIWGEAKRCAERDGIISKDGKNSESDGWM